MTLYDLNSMYCLPFLQSFDFSSHQLATLQHRFAYQLQKKFKSLMMTNVILLIITLTIFVTDSQVISIEITK